MFYSSQSRLNIWNAHTHTHSKRNTKSWNYTVENPAKTSTKNYFDLYTIPPLEDDAVCVCVWKCLVYVVWNFCKSSINRWIRIRLATRVAAAAAAAEAFTTTKLLACSWFCMRAHIFEWWCWVVEVFDTQWWREMWCGCVLNEIYNIQCLHIQFFFFFSSKLLNLWSSSAHQKYLLRFMIFDEIQYITYKI